ncbi:Carboxylesterase NlhH [Methylibium sp. T29]|uniref:alpha/beta hydrolase n=2 Tax=unclassified Methylibium TaxID=2633235 RepID=UPI0003F40FF2|nr:alpha/beta hydrolase [Methylibium sp. T29-B]EWS53590.1 Carboxylesterase NlhH [Methylibium sp. T29]EWS57973.1 Carboxylesterase NlhH [Methylibium sp. T29-B]
MPSAAFQPPQHGLTPTMRDVLDRMRRAGRPPLHTMSVDAAREAYRLGAEILDLPRVALARVEDLLVPARDGHLLPARLYAPSGARLPVLLYLHGGGFTIGSLDTHDSLCRQLALQGGAAVLSLDYRLAPEHRFPAAVDDAWDALQWLAREGGARLGLDATRLAVGGDSAGGTLSAVCALMARDAALPLALQLLFYPGTAARQDSDSHRRFAEGVLLARPLIDWFFGHYIATEHREDWRFAPLLAPDHGGVAPAWIGLAECDPLVDEGVAYGDVLRAAGVPVQLELWRGVVHDFIKMGRAVPEARQAHAAAAQALREAFSP